MQYMIMHKTSAHWEAGAKPTLELIQRVGGMIGELQRSGVMVAGEGLGPSSQGARVRLTKGESTVTPGPFGGAGSLPARYMAVLNANAASEAGTPLSPEQLSALKAFSDELSLTGAFSGFEHFEPSTKGKRLRPPAGAKGPAATAVKAKHVVLDGPFTETKELIGGFVIVEVPSVDDAVRWAQKYVEAVGVEEVDVRGLASVP